MPVDFYSLPVYKHKVEIIKELEENQVIIVESPTGSGKTTQLPLILREAEYDKKGIIGITQPRRIATLNISDFIKKQIGDDKSYVGYSMRFFDTTTAETRIKVMTDGILLQEVKADSTLSRYSVIMVDEAHERSLNIDFILGLLKEITEVRKDLKIIISSATINASSFSSFFSSAPVISISGKVYDVDVRYKSMILEKGREDEYFFKIKKIVDEAIKENPGDILIFLPGEKEIKDLVLMLESSKERKRYQVYPLYGRLSREDQARVFEETKKGKTKIVVSTNIAETSITIDGITTVIDSGLARINYYNQNNFTSALVTAMISRASADQRRGRAGRTREGRCYRLYSKDNYNARKEYSEEEILHSDLAEVVLRMSELGIYNYESFPFITRPSSRALESAVSTLLEIGAIDERRMLTKIGQMMIKFPLLPRLSRVIVEAVYNYPKVLDDVLVAVSFLSTKQPYALPVGEEAEARSMHEAFQDSRFGDFIGMRRLYGKYTSLEKREDKESFAKHYYLDIQTMDEIVHIHAQLSDLVSAEGIPITGGGSIKEYFCCLISGLRQFVARRDSTSYAYRTAGADNIFIHPGSSWFRTMPDYIIAGEIVRTTKLYARTVSPIEKSWIMEVYPLFFEKKEKKKKEKKKEKEEKKKATDGEYKNYEMKKSGKKMLPVIPFEDLKSIEARNSDRFYLKTGSLVFNNPVKFSKIDMYLSLLKPDSIKQIKGSMSTSDKDFHKMLSCLFHVLKGKKGALIYSLTGSEDRYALRPAQSLDEAASETLETLYDAVEYIQKSDKKKKNMIYDCIAKIESALGLR